MSEWKEERLGALGKTFTGLTGKSAEDFGSGKPYIPYMNIFTNGRIDPEWMEYVKVETGERQSRVQYGDLLFTTSSETVDEVGMTAVLLDDIGEAYLNSFCFGFRLHDFETLLPEYAVYLFRSQEVRKAISLLGQGSTRYNLPKTPLLERLKLKIPDPDTQRTIARSLGVVDGLIERTEALIAKQQQIKQGLLHDLFTRGVDAQGRLRPPHSEAPELYHETALGWLPMGWGVERMDAIGRLRGGKRLPKGMPFADGPTPFPYVRVVDMHDGGVDTNALVYVTPVVQQFIAQYTIGHNDIYISIAGTIGLFGRVPEELDGAQLTENALKLCEIDLAKANIEFLIEQFNSHLIQSQIAREIGTGGGVPKLAMHRVAATSVRMPKKPEQDAIAERLRIARSTIVSEQHHLEKLRLLKSGLMQDLLTGRVSVQRLVGHEVVGKRATQHAHL